MLDQATQLRQLMERGAVTPRAGGGPTLLAVCGGKGGVGATTVAVNLALALVLDGRRTVLVDAACESSDVALYCDLPRRESIQDVLTGRRDVHEVLQPGPAGLLVLPGDPDRPHDPDANQRAQVRLLNQLRGLARFADFVVLDGGRGLARAAQCYLRHADARLVVASPDHLAVMDAYGLLKSGRSWASEATALVVNLADDAAQAQEVHARLALACRRFLGLRLTLAGHVARDRRLAEAPAGGRPAVSEYPHMPGLFGFEALVEHAVSCSAAGGRSVMARLG